MDAAANGISQPSQTSGKILKVKLSRKKKCRQVPYVAGFRPPRPSDIVKAIGSTTPLPIELETQTENEGFFYPIPQPTHIDDWLAQYNEEGQTYRDFIKQCPWLSNRRCKGMAMQRFLPNETSLPRKYPEGKIYIVPLVTADSDETLYFENLIDYASRFLCLPVVALPPIKIVIEGSLVYWVDDPEDTSTENDTIRKRSTRVKRHKLESRYNSKTKHLQLRVDSNLLELRRRMPPDAICMVGLTNFDLYGDETDLFVAGMAAGNHRVGVFSFFRYDPALTFSTEFWHSIKRSDSIAEEERLRLILERSCKLVVHEIGHLLGIAHCIYFDCCMNGSGHLTEDFRQPMFLCPVDLHKLQTLVGCDISQRYENLLKFYSKHQMDKEAEWVRRRLKFIRSKTDSVNTEKTAS